MTNNEIALRCRQANIKNSRGRYDGVHIMGIKGYKD